MKYEIILFDVDDTLLDFGVSEEQALSNAFLEFDLPSGLANYHTSYKEISKVLWQDLEQGNATISELGVERFKRLFNQHGLEINAEQFNRTYLNYLGKEIHPIEGVEALCENLREYRLAILSNGFEKVQKSRVEDSPLCNMFEDIITSEEAGAQKPSKEIFDYAFSKLAITSKSNVLMVGDSLTSDIRGGQHYGIDTCWFNRYGRKNNLGIKPTYEICELMDLVKVLKS